MQRRGLNVMIANGKNAALKMTEKGSMSSKKNRAVARAVLLIKKWKGNNSRSPNQWRESSVKSEKSNSIEQTSIEIIMRGATGV